MFHNKTEYHQAFDYIVFEAQNIHFTYKQQLKVLYGSAKVNSIYPIAVICYVYLKK